MLELDRKMTRCGCNGLKQLLGLVQQRKPETQPLNQVESQLAMKSRLNHTVQTRLHHHSRDGDGRCAPASH